MAEDKAGKVTGVLYWSKGPVAEYPKIRSTPKWLFAILHPFLYRRMFNRSASGSRS